MNLQFSLPMLYAGASTDIGVESVEGLEVTYSSILMIISLDRDY